MQSHKGSVIDFIIIMVMLLATAFSILISYKVLGDYNTKASTMGIDSHYYEKSASALRVFNGTFLFLIIGSGISVLVSAFMFRTHPAFFIFSLLALTIVIGLAGILSNVFTEFSSSSAFSSVLGYFGTMVAVMKKLPLWVFGLGTLALIVMFSRMISNKGSEGSV